MKILYDHQIFSYRDYGGVSRYFYELIKQFKKNKYDIFIEGRFSNNIDLVKLKPSTVRILPKYNFPYKNTLLFYLNNIFGERLLYKNNFDLFHATYYHPYFLNKLKGKPYVITVYDMIHEIFSKDYKDLKNQTSDHKRKTIISADQIIAISKNTKKDLIKLYNVPKSKVNVVYLGNPLEGIKPIIVKGLPKKYLLFVGNRLGYKNFINFIKSIAPILKEDKNLFLVCAGGGRFLAEEKMLLSKLKIENQISQVSFRSDSELAYIYKNALVYVLPSLYEGFGMTALEAFSMGCPVVASNTSSIPEVCGKAAVYIDPKYSKTIKDRIEKVIRNEKLRLKLVRLGYKQVKKFSWAKTVKETLKVYEKAIKTKE